MLPAVPFIDLGPVVRLVRDGALARWAAALDRCELVGGATVGALEAALATATGAPRVVACSNGSDALIIALAAAGVAPGDHVAMPNLTFWATFEAVLHLGAVPVLVDVDPVDLQLDVDALEHACRRHPVRHVVTVHLFGWASARLLELRERCQARGLTLVEDNAQGFGVTVGCEPVARGATIATLSMYPAKVLGGAMDGGAILCGDEALEAKVRCLANHGRAGHYRFGAVGWNSRMSSAAAGYLLELLPHAASIVAARRAAAARYRAAANAWPAVMAHGPPPGVEDNGYLCVLACAAPDERARAFAARGIATARTYPETIDQQRPAAGRFVAGGDLDVSRTFCARALNLPLFYGLTEGQQERVLTAAAEIFATPP